MILRVKFPIYDRIVHDTKNPRIESKIRFLIYFLCKNFFEASIKTGSETVSKIPMSTSENFTITATDIYTSTSASAKIIFAKMTSIFWSKIYNPAKIIYQKKAFDWERIVIFS